MKILIKAKLAYVKDEVLRGVYLGIDNSKLVSITREEPEEFEDAELILGGEDRILSPGFISVHTVLSLYPFRYNLVSGRQNVNDVISVLGQKDVYSLSMMGAYHLLRSGVTTAVTADPFPESVARAMIKVGIRPIIAVPVNCSWGSSDWKREFKVLYDRWKGQDTRIVFKLCSQEETDEVVGLSREFKVPILVDRLVDLSQSKGLTSNDLIVGMGGASRGDLEFIRERKLGISFLPSIEVCKFTLGALLPSVSLDLSLSYDIRRELGYAVSRLLLTPEEAVRSGTLWGYRQLRLNYPLELGVTPDFALYQVNEPPFYPLDYSSPYETLLFSTGVPETVVVGGEPVLDGTVPLNVGLKDVESAQEIVRDIGGKKSTLEKN
ncbi:amidohydrolase [Metallosphaera tengchongensis]|uniref:Amidohydrolase n=1 Tax=Metallosphaera tengchongensis TaxID=1532350 RepID=A0A6N0NYA6_9CREN|nr:amidohydrolase [Metallosphaera tengchongensis]QKR00559.1 amidohydrolase [Metallosphaera tengchongensis]